MLVGTPRHSHGRFVLWVRKIRQRLLKSGHTFGGQCQMETRIHTTVKRRHLHSHQSVEQKLSSQTTNTTRLLQNNQRWLPKINHTTL